MHYFIPVVCFQFKIYQILLNQHIHWGEVDLPFFVLSSTDMKYDFCMYVEQVKIRGVNKNK